MIFKSIIKTLNHVDFLLLKVNIPAFQISSGNIIVRAFVVQRKLPDIAFSKITTRIVGYQKDLTHNYFSTNQSPS